MRHWIITEDEDDALQGLPMLAQLIYLRGIRPFMDRGTGVAGVKRGISYRGLSETVYVEPAPGRTDSGRPSLQQVRTALSQLRQAGLVGTKDDTQRKRLFFLCLKALSDQSDPKKVNSKLTVSQQTQSNTGQTSHTKGSREKANSKSTVSQQTQSNTHQLSVVSSTSDAYASGAEQPVDNSPEQLAKQLFDTGVAILTGANVAEEKARQVVGQLRKALGDGRALEALLAARSTTDPLNYLRKVVHNGKGTDAWQECHEFLRRGRPKDFVWSDPIIEQACKRVGSELYTASTRDAEAIFKRSFSEVRATH